MKHRRELDKVLENFDDERRSEFYRSLNKTLMSISGDSVLKQLMKSKESRFFVTKRIEEIIYKVATDEREEYILKLGKRIKSLKKVKENCNNDQILQVGKKVLDISTKQNDKEVEYQRVIIALKKQVKDLNDEVVKLRVKKAVDDVKTNAENKLKPKRNANDPNFKNIERTVNVTDMSLRVQKMQTDIMTLKELVVTMKDLIPKIINQSTIKMKKYYETRLQEVEELRNSLNNEKKKYAELQNRLDNELIPKFINSKKQLSEKHKEINESRIKEVDDMRKMLYKITNEQKTNQYKLQYLEKENKELKEENQRNSRVIRTLRDTINRLRKDNEDNIMAIGEKNSRIRIVEDANLELKDKNENLQCELDLSRQNEEELLNKNIEIGTLYNELHLSSQTSSDLVKSLKVENERLRSAKERCEEKINVINNVKSQFMLKEKELSGKNRVLKKEIIKLKEAIKKGTEENEILKAKVNDLETEIRNINSSENALSYNADEYINTSSIISD